MNKDAIKPMAARPHITSHIFAVLSAYAPLTVVLRGSGKELINGIAEYTIATPPGSSLRYSAGTRFLSSFCRTVVPIVTPQTYCDNVSV